VDPVDRLRTAGKRMTDPLELRAQIVAEHVIDLVVHSLDMNYLVRQVDLNAVIAQVDLNELLAQVDINAIVRRVDIDALVEQTDIGAVIARSSGGVASDALDVLRSQAVGLDEFIARWVAQLRRRPYTGAPGPPGPPRVQAGP
jgi:hydrogenase maturation factor